MKCLLMHAFTALIQWHFKADLHLQEGNGAENKRMVFSMQVLVQEIRFITSLLILWVP